MNAQVGRERFKHHPIFHTRLQQANDRDPSQVWFSLCSSVECLVSFKKFPCDESTTFAFPLFLEAPSALQSVCSLKAHVALRAVLKSTL